MLCINKMNTFLSRVRPDTAKILINTFLEAQSVGIAGRGLEGVLEIYVCLDGSNTAPPICWGWVAKLGQAYKRGHVAVPGCRSYKSRVAERVLV